MLDVHYLNCGAASPLGARLFPRRFEKEMVCRCVLLHSSGVLVLVDSGLSVADLENPRRLGSMGKVLGIRGSPAEAARKQIEKLGHDPEDVRHIVLTHLDLDHASGLVDFPRAKIHVCRAELDAAMRPRTWSERKRYRAYHWEHAPHWVPHELSVLEDSAALPCAPIDELPLPMGLVPLFGHTRGHCGVWIDLPEQKILHCGDAYYSRTELSSPTSWPYRVFQSLTHVDVRLAMKSRAVVKRVLVEESEVRVVSAHDPREA